LRPVDVPARIAVINVLGAHLPALGLAERVEALELSWYAVSLPGLIVGRYPGI
jgi:hypothetical protein